MAQNAPRSEDVTHIQFKIHDKFDIFNFNNNLRSNVNLLAAASNYGLVFAANPNEPEIKVLIHKGLAEAKENNGKLLARCVPISTPANNIAVSCDGAMLAVNITQNGCALLAIFSVQSFYSASVKQISSIRLSPEDNVQATQLLWNPVIPNTLAVVLSNGSMGMYNLKDTAYEFFSIDKQEQVQSACWSPKGKQIVVGFPNGKVAQYKPDLKLARTIPGPTNIMASPFDTIAIQWLSTYQFAVVFCQKGEDAKPNLLILNAPKTGQPTYINYYDISYGSSEPREIQVFLQHIQPWNLLLMATSNSNEVGMLGTKESGETPTWIQYVPLDEARIEVPLTKDKQETFPIGFALDTASSHQLVIEENTIPVMPMLHVLSTHGQLIAYDFLNLAPGAPGICSPSPPPSDGSGLPQFRPIDLGSSELPFTVPSGATSTPAVKEKPKPLFGVATTAPPSTVSSFSFAQPTASPFSAAATSTSSLFSSTPAAASSPAGGLFSGFAPAKFGQTESKPSFGLATQPESKPSFGLSSQPESKPSFGISAQPSAPSALFGQVKDVKKDPLAVPQPEVKSTPLYTVPGSFTPPTGGAAKAQHFNQIGRKSPEEEAKFDQIINEMIAIQINSFSSELQQLTAKSKDNLIAVGSMDDVRAYTKRLNDLQELIDRANEHEIEVDIQNLRHSLNESYNMVIECRSKLDMYKNPDLSKLTVTSSANQINRRQLKKLQSYVAVNQAQLQLVQHHIDAQWSSYQDLVQKTSKTKMHTPSLEGIYQTLSKQKDILARQRMKLNYIRSKLAARGLKDNSKWGNTNVESLTDSILSMSLSHVVEESAAKLNAEKAKALKDVLKGRKITIVKPKRPDRVDLKSEVILETKIRAEKKAREGAATNVDKMEQQRIHTTDRALPKPTATRPKPMAPLAAPAPSKPALLETKPNAFATLPAGTTISFGPPKDSGTSQAKPVSANEAPSPAVPISFSPKVISGSGSIGFGSGESKPSAFSFGGILEESIKSTPSFGSGQAATAEPSKPSSGFSFGMQENSFKVPTFGSASSPAVVKPAVATQVSTPVAATVTSKASFSFPSFGTPASTTVTTIATPTPIKPVTTTVASAAATTKAHADPTDSLFGNLNICKPTTDTTSSNAPKPVFGLPGLSESSSSAETKSIFGSSGNTATDAPIRTTTASSPLSFGGFQLPASTPAPTATPAVAPVFGMSKKADSTVSFDVPTTTTTSAPVSSSSTSLFGGTGSSTSVFSSATPFAGTIPATGSIFGTSTTSVASPFAAALATTASTSASATSTPATTTTSVASPFATAAASTVSLFSGASISSSAATTKPSQVAVSTAPLFGGLAASTATTTSTTGTSAASPFGAAAASTASLFSAASLATSAAPATVASTAAASTAPIFAGFAASTAATTSTTGTSVTSAAASTASLFSGASISTSAAPVSATSAASPFAAAAASTAPLFGGITASTATTTSTTGTSVASPFAAAAASTASLFAGASISTSAAPATVASVASPFASVAASTTSLFGGSTAPASTTTVAGGPTFGGIPKPDQSVFAQTTSASATSPFFGAGAATTSAAFGAPLFGAAPSASSGGSIFGGTGSAGGGLFGSPNTATTNAGSVFGGGGSGLFGSATGSAGGGSPFASAAQSNQQSSGGSLFGQSAFGQSGQSTGSIFGNAANTSTGSTGFGGGSIFGGNASASQGSSLFGGAGSQQQTTSPFGAAGTQSAFGAQPSAFGSSAFGGQSSAFGSPSQSGSFAQGGPGVAEAGFGSPQSTAFPKPAFGAAPAFGSPPTFGGAPSFGGAPVFGSPPKAFGGFGSAAASGTSAFASPTQKNNLFETLGSTDNGLSFGNLAQSQGNQNKPAFGGSAFTNYRS